MTRTSTTTKMPRKKLGEKAKKQPPAAPATGCVTGVDEVDVIDLSGEPAAAAGTATGPAGPGPVLSGAQRAHDEKMTELREKVEAARRALDEYAGRANRDWQREDNLRQDLGRAEYVLRTHWPNRAQVLLAADPKGRYMRGHSGWFGTEEAVKILLGRRNRLVDRGAGMLLRLFTDTLNDSVRQKMQKAAVAVGQRFELPSPLYPSKTLTMQIVRE